MNRSRRFVMLAGLGVLLATASASAETVERGPYYALPSWDLQFKNASTRFIVLSNWNKEAVLDQETGLVWELSPSTSTNSWTGALAACRDANTGGRFGWRLPQQEELASLGVPDAMTPSVPDLPTGSPFPNASGVTFWTASTDEADSGQAWIITFGPAGGMSTNGKGTPFHAWCVRGGHGALNPQ